MKIEFWKCLKTWAIPIYITWHHGELEISILCFHWYLISKTEKFKNLLIEHIDKQLSLKECSIQGTKDEAMQNL